MTYNKDSEKSNVERLESENARLKEDIKKYKQTIMKIKELGLFNLNNTREKIAKINSILIDLESEVKNES